MSVLLYRFDRTDTFRVLDSRTTARGPVSIQVQGEGKGAFLRVSLSRRDADRPEPTVAVALPLVAIDWEPRVSSRAEARLDLTVLGDASGSRLILEAGDGSGAGLEYDLGSVDFTGVRVCSAYVQQPSGYWSPQQSQGTPEVLPPLQLYRLAIRLPSLSERIGVGVGALTLAGDVRLTHPGIAGTEA